MDERVARVVDGPADDLPEETGNGPADDLPEDTAEQHRDQTTHDPANAAVDAAANHTTGAPTARTLAVASPRMRALAKQVVARPALTVGLTLLLTLLAFIPLQGLDTSTSLEDYLPPTEEVAAGREAHHDFPLASTVVTVVQVREGAVTTGGAPVTLLGREALAEMAALELHLARDQDLAVWLYNTTSPIMSPGGLMNGALAQAGLTFETVPEPLFQALLDRFIHDARSGGLFGRAVNVSGTWQASSVLLSVQLDKGGAYNDETSELELQRSVHSYRSRYLALHTLAAASKEMEKASTETLATLLPVSFLLMGALIYFSLRRVSDTLLSLLTVMLALVWMFAAGELLGLGFSQYTFIAPILVLALGVDDAIHMLHRYREEYSLGRERAIAGAIGMVGTALVLTTLTTMVAFGSNRMSQVPALRDFGLHVALGIGSAFLLTCTFLPAARLLLDRFLKAELDPLDKVDWATPVLRPLILGAQRHGRVVIIAALLLTLGSLGAASTLDQELEESDLLDPDSEIYIGFTLFQQDYQTTSGEAAGLLITGHQLARPQVLEAMLAVQADMDHDDRIAQLNGQPRALSIATYAMAAFPTFAARYNLSDVDGNNLPDTPEATRLLLDRLTGQGLDHPQLGNVTPRQMRALARPDGHGDYNGLLVVVTSANIGTLGGGELLDQLEGDTPPLTTLGLKVTPFGIPIERYQMLTTMTRGMLDSVAVSILLCLVLLVGLRRSVREGLEAILPVLLVAAWVYGTIWALGWALNVVTVSIAAITIGVGVDFAIHLLHRYRESRSLGLPPEQAMQEAVERTGQPLLGATLTTMAGFGVLYFSPMNIFSQFGLLTALMVVYALLATLVVLPVVMLRFSR